MKKVILVVLMFCNFFCSYCFAGNAWANETIERILVHDDGTTGFGGQVHITMASDMTWMPACVSSDSYKNLFLLDLGRGAASAQFSALLTAKVSGKSVTVQVNDKCINGVAVVRNVSIVE